MFSLTSVVYAQNVALPCPTPDAVSVFPRGDWFYSMALSPDGQQLGVVARSGIYLFDSSTLTLVKAIACFDDVFEGFAIAWSPNSRYLAHVQKHYDSSTEAYAYNLNIWDIERQNRVTLVDITNLPDWASCSIETLSWSPNGDYLAMSCPMYILSVSDIARPELAFTSRQTALSNQSSILPNTLSWSEEAEYLAAANGEEIFIWNTQTWGDEHNLHLEPASSISPGTTTLSWTSAGYLAAGGYDQPLYLWETQSWSVVELYTPYQANVVQFLPATSVLAFAGDPGDYSREWRNRVITILDVSTNQVLQQLVVPDIPNVEGARGTYVNGIEWLPDGRHLLSLQTEETVASIISLWDIETGEILAEISLSALNS